MWVCVTGASGFIGRHVVKALKDAGHEVIGLDIGEVTTTPWVTADITKAIPAIPNLDAVIHLAALSHPRQCDDDPIQAFNVNVNGTYQVLKMAMESGVKKVVFSSSAHVYDIPPKYLPTDEAHPLRLNNIYTTTKLLGEQLCELYWTNHGLSYTTLRLYNAYGPGQLSGYFIPDMLSKTGDIELGVGGHTTKDWVWIDDVARAFVLAINTPFVGAINIGSGVETPLHLIAGEIAARSGHQCHTDASDNASRMWGDVARAKRILNWEPTKSISEGLNEILSLAKV